METDGGVMIALDYSGCMAARYIIMLEPAAGAGTHKQINSIPVRVNYMWLSVCIWENRTYHLPR